MTDYLKKAVLFTAPQRERVKQLRSIVPQWLSELKHSEQLVVGIPKVLGDWVDAFPVVLNPGMATDFLVWLDEAEETITGPVYNLPALSAPFVCIVIDAAFDPLQHELPRGGEEITGTFASLARSAKQQARAA